MEKVTDLTSRLAPYTVTKIPVAARDLNWRAMNGLAVELLHGAYEDFDARVIQRQFDHEVVFAEKWTN